MTFDLKEVKVKSMFVVYVYVYDPISQVSGLHS